MSEKIKWYRGMHTTQEWQTKIQFIRTAKEGVYGENLDYLTYRPLTEGQLNDLVAEFTKNGWSLFEVTVTRKRTPDRRSRTPDPIKDSRRKK